MSVEFLVASAIGVLTAAGIYLILRLRTFPVILGTSFLSYAVNVFLFTTGRLAVGAPPILDKYAENPVYTDPLPQALVLTAIVISFGMTAVVLMIALSAYLSGGHDKIDMQDETESEERA
ncbi:Na+/H+ antiporter subunit C [Donghicola tyrosinivorans]|uniref:Multicomponent K+:H+ antiporter subunit C n=1 Tax=Donghicola tyrosinivorans TaxID=1652492 RepID=A0A2T0WYE5_9RHOB|nr:Na+/H+ antiporter subunit C [Donghicola tyrosinivorans]PRY91675.1 multicomponent K+:H+ antiporter subunit C [Donghicola tyrosinivorans]